jgi:transcriptional regulator with XRE-family HTH domain
MLLGVDLLMRDAHRLVAVSRELDQASTMEQVQQLVRSAARQLSGADGAAFVIREGDHCLYADEDAISPLWKGRRFHVSECVGGWCMLNRAAAVVEDVYADDRTPDDSYRDTFVRSLVMVPIRRSDPVGAIGVYWAQRRVPLQADVEQLQALADSTSVAMERIRTNRPRTPAAPRTALAGERCRNLYVFVRLRLGPQLSDRELARRWGMNWRSFLNLKEGSRRVPRLEELETLAEVLKVDPALVILVARGEPADVVNRWVLSGEGAIREGLLARLELSAASSDSPSDSPVLHLSIDHIPCGLVTMDMRGRVCDFNARLASLVADAAQLNLGAHFINLVAPDSAAAFLKLETQALERGEAGPELVWLDQGDALDMSMVSVADSDGRNVGFQGVLQPLPERLAALIAEEYSGPGS